MRRRPSSGVSRAGPEVLPTSIGPPLRRRGALWTIDTTRLPVFHGLSVLARSLAELTLERGRAGGSEDLDIERPLRASENPELRALGIERVRLLAEPVAVAALPRDPEGFEDRLRAVFGALQIEPWRRALLPAGRRAPSRALVFDFPLGATRGRAEARYVLERVGIGEGRFLLRLAIGEPRHRRTDVPSAPPLRIEGLGGRRFLAGSTRIAQTLRDLLQRAAERGRRSLLESWRPDSFLFQRLAKVGFGGLRALSLTWSERLSDDLVEIEPARLEGALKKVFLVLEDGGLRERLGAGDAVLVRDGDFRLYLDLSQHGRTLNLALDQPRHRPHVEDFLARMPRLAALVRARARARPLARVRVFLVHHITSEILATVAALRALGCAELVVLFVRYAGEIPNDYLEALMDLDPATFSAFALHNVKDPENAEGTFVLSRQFSPLGDLERLDAEFHARRPGYFDAMVRLAGALFARMLARNPRVPLLLIEDGGYLAPLLAEEAARGASLGRFLVGRGLAPIPAREGRRPLARVLDGRLLGTVEHTRNGHDRLAAAQARHGGLARPAFSIAVSRTKVEEESEEVAASILNAVETVLQASGRVLSLRRPLVLGSRGAIGSRLVRRLRGRVAASPQRPILGIDRRAGEGPSPEGGDLLVEARRWSELPPDARRRVDLLLGVTGTSVLGAREMEELLRAGTAESLVFASGSTKTVEFHDAAVWAERRLAAPGEPGRAEEIVDPQTGRVYGTRYAFPVGAGRARREKRFEFLANLTPVNFLFYGVPTEGMDAVLAQLLATSLGLARAARSRGGLRKRLYAVDRDIDGEGRALRARGD
ncbi:MAG TPA: hypothetical protein VFI25_09940 [Planctomycetota bacterium]|jgi:hypothetical protein|nr:hypothetical protein [Planctomycetota bacterium]